MAYLGTISEGRGTHFGLQNELIKENINFHSQETQFLKGNVKYGSLFDAFWHSALKEHYCLLFDS